MSFEAWVGVIGGIIFILGAVSAFILKLIRSSIIEEVDAKIEKLYTSMDTTNAETFKEHQELKNGLASLIEKRITESFIVAKDNAALMRKNDSDQITNIDKQVNEMKLITAKQLAEISVDLKAMSANMSTFSEKLVENRTEISFLKRDVGLLKENKA